ncbi:hypothetical protein K458DRAFT_381358 [Lentithecium fluviatile CBS 122367]|uniref:Mediator of RNA polymerase II transcription subunit 12 n=1 Tax=Lentithecium fluviatile CBS 122367 TaxID=1168545 RepID=A0A6G1JN04_9PLEO|nr:hypothetical protein K458DRAFT_381358 [Lentithecium fluviatile CBS 122367]
MTSRPGPGIHESLQHRGGGPAYASVRRAANSQHGQLDSSADSERAPAEERATQARSKGKLVPLEGIQATPADSVRPAPRGQPQLFFSNAPPSSSELPAHGQPLANLPVPPRPGSSAPGDFSQQRRIVPGGTGVKDEAAARAQASDTPALAVIFSGGKTADFFPWTGSHPEDVLSEALVKGGMSNKAQIMNETNTARPSLWSNLKNKSGVSTLSTLFVAVLEKRQNASRLTVPHTFKPPPRLTLRDSTRETWLKDLANPMVRLGRLSRTIPTGVTGKVLLEQCLNKNIPLPRAMWLAKCIGINEIRTHKRKGQAGTNNYYITWVRGWTSAVEQFLESIAATIGQEEWKPRITYALQLTTHLFKEHLLEEDHYLDWILKSLDSSSSERLFLWLLIVCIPDFWVSLISSRRRGKRLAESLLGHADKLYSLEEAQNTPVLALLENTIFRLILAKPGCLLLPRTWEKHRVPLQTFVRRRCHAGITNAVADLDARNSQLSRPSGTAASNATDAVGQIYTLLDSVDYSTILPIDELAFDCMEVISDAGRLTSTVMQWASSIYRQGSHRIYLATRLLRKWSQLGADVYDGILAYLPIMALDQSKEPAVVFRVIAELLRSKTFSLGRYLQWLIATGSLSHHSDLRSTSAWPLRLITELPLAGLSAHVQNLRRTLLRGTVYSIDAEEQAIVATQETIRQQLPGLFDAEMNNDERASVDVTLLSRTVRLEIGIWLRQQVVESTELVDCIPTKDPGIEVSGTVCRISLSDFHVIRTYLELFDDLAILADIIGIVATSFDSNVLSAAADTLHYNYKAFRAIGAFEPLFEKIAMRYAAIRTVRFPERELLHSLMDLSRTAHADSQLMQLLNYDISRYDQKNSLAVCSPVSDNMAEGGAVLDVEDEIERILSNGTSMDQQLMSRVFGKIAKYLEEQLCQGNHYVESFSTWLYRLRNFEESTFDLILSSWLRSLLMNHQTQLLSAALPPLVASGSLTLTRFLMTVRECIRSRKTNQPSASLRIAVDGLQRILPCRRADGIDQKQDLYRYRHEQYKFCRQHNGGLLNLVRDVVQLDVSAAEGESQHQVQSIISDDRLLDVLRYLAVYDSQSWSALTAVSSQNSAQAIHMRIKSILDRLFDPVNHLEFSKMDVEQQIATVVQRADPLSLPFCQLELQHIFSASTLKADDEVDRVSEALVSAVKTAIDEDQPCWPDLISGLEPSLMNKIREHAEREIISASQFLCGPVRSKIDGHINDKQASVRKYLSVIDATCTGPSQEVQPALLHALVERFKGAVELLSAWKETLKSGTLAEGTWMKFDLSYWLDALLRITVAHAPVLVLKASNQHQAALMWTLRALIAHSGLDAFPPTARSLFDVATLLSDSISDDVRKQLARLDIAKPVDNDRCAFIFGSTPPPDGWLSLTKPVNAASSAQAASSSQTQPQQPKASPSQYHGQPQQNPGPGPGALQRSLSQQHLQQPVQLQGPTRSYSQYSQPSKMLPQQLQRIASNSQSGQATQLHQLQQMQALAQQRNIQQAPLGQQQRTTAPSTLSLSTGKASAVKQEKADMRSVPFAVNRWELLPECGGNPFGNETAISLSLFGARKV